MVWGLSSVTVGRRLGDITGTPVRAALLAMIVQDAILELELSAAGTMMRLVGVLHLVVSVVPRTVPVVLTIEFLLSVMMMLGLVVRQ